MWTYAIGTGSAGMLRNTPGFFGYVNAMGNVEGVVKGG